VRIDFPYPGYEAMGLELRVPDAGCCGMAGAFGFEPDDTLIIADGFSCREQIAQCTDREALHLAEVIELAWRDGPRGASGARPEALKTRNLHETGRT
jgi:hypothetical protein